MEHMKGILCLLLFITLTLSGYTQNGTMLDSITDLNCLNGGIYSPSIFNSMEEIEISAMSDSLSLPFKVYNDEHAYFPPIFSQIGNSCAQVAEIGYCFTYEINRVRNVSAGDWYQNKHNCYHPSYTYNFLNDGSPFNGTTYTNGFSMIKEIGCPDYSIYYDQILESDTGFSKYQYWMSGYNKYNSALRNKVTDYKVIRFNNTYSSLSNLKHWLSDHGIGDSTGGVAIIAVYTDGWITNSEIPYNSPEEAGKKMVSQWGVPTPLGHALTIVGYNDEIWCIDINGDNQYTVDQDVNGDNIVDLNDCEKGAFRVANSHGTIFGNDGYIFIPYRLFVGGLQLERGAYTCIIDTSYSPSIVLKSSITHPKRNMIKARIGYAIDAIFNSTIIDTVDYKILNHQGGQFPICYPYSDTMNIAFDFGFHFGNKDFGKICLIIDSYSHLFDAGKINSLSMFDYRWGEEFEILCNQSNVLLSNGGQTILSINYDLIPHESPITTDLLLYSDMVSRFNPVVDGANTTLTINDIDIDMYNSTITVKSGSEMVINDGAVFNAKQGTCRIEIEGDIQIGNNVSFIAEQGAKIELIISNSDVDLDIANCVFENCSVISSAESVSITWSDFENSNIYCENGNGNSESATISNNTFIDGTEIAIDLYRFENYLIEQNSIDNMKCGVMLTKCGDGIPGNQTMANNDIIDCTTTGIHLYESVSYISENLVSLCNEGVRLENKSTTSIYGNPNATSYTQMNRFYNEDSYELYISKYSFPWYFHYNAIIDNDNGGNIMGDPLLYYDNVSDVNQPAPKNVEYNCWGTNFNAQMDLYPINGFDYSPTYCPPSAPMLSSPVETLYQNSLDQFSDGEYAQSKAGFMFLIDQYPSTKYAQSAMRELVYLEGYAGNDYASLKTYYQTNAVIQSDTILTPLASKLANECDIKLENYTEAVTYFEGVIADPADTQDSIYAIIDLGYLYETMDTGNKASYVGKMPQYKPKTFSQFKKYKLDLLSLLPVVKETETGNEEYDREKKSYFTIQPNPLNESTTFGYTLQKEGYVEFRIFATDGTPIETINEGFQNTGSHEYTYNSSSLDAGIYYCSLVVNNVILETRKMIVIS